MRRPVSQENYPDKLTHWDWTIIDTVHTVIAVISYHENLTDSDAPASAWHSNDSWELWVFGSAVDVENSLDQFDSVPLNSHDAFRKKFTGVLGVLEGYDVSAELLPCPYPASQNVVAHFQRWLHAGRNDLEATQITAQETCPDVYQENNQEK